MKRIISFLVTALMLASLFTVNAYAAGVQYFYQDFENVSSNDNKSGFTSGSANEELLMREIIDDPYLEGNKVVKFVNRKSGVNVINSYMNSTGVISGECIFTFDYIQLSTKGDPMDVKYVMIELSKGGPSGSRPRIGLTMMNYADGFRLTPEDNVWYSFIAHVNSDFSSLALYRKERDSDEPFAFVRNQARGNMNGSNVGGFRVYNGQVDYMMDNIRLYQGSLGNDGYFEMNGEKITKLDEVTSGTLTATVSYICGDVRTATSDDKTVITDSAEVFPFAVVYDVSGKMIDCVALENAAISAGEQKLSLEIDTSGFYDKLDDGYIGYYVWKDFTTAEPLIDAIELY